MYERKKTFFWEAVRLTVPARYHTSSDRNMRPRYLLRGQEIPVSGIPKIPAIPVEDLRPYMTKCEKTWAIIREKEGAWVGWEGGAAVRHGVG